MIVEAFIQMRGNALSQILDERRKEKPSQAALKANKFLRELIGAEIWRTAPGPGGRLTRISVLCDSDDLDELVAELHPTAEVIGCWKPDGYQLGIEPEVDAEGNVIGSSGVATYPLDRAALIDMLPDINGQRPDAPYQAHQYAGWQPRIVPE